jgi:hypothetical protein
MTAAELAEATKEFDRPLPASRYKPLSKAQRALFERAKRAGGKATGQLHAFDLDEQLLLQATAYARKKRLTLNQVVERGLRRELAVTD